MKYKKAVQGRPSRSASTYLYDEESQFGLPDYSAREKNLITPFADALKMALMGQAAAPVAASTDEEETHTRISV